MSHQNDRLAAWTRVRRPRPAAGIDLVCLPHAGGSASFYREWGDLLGEAPVEVHVVQYPGREDRFLEDLVDAMDPMADAVAEVVMALPHRPTVLFGHSMGAAIGYEVTRRLEAAGAEPTLLVVSGMSAPHRRKRDTLHLRDDDALVEELRRLSPETSAALDSPDLREMLMPMIRADYTLIETYHPENPPPVHTPLVVFHGVADPDVTEAQAAAWAELAESGELRGHRVFGGDHFYLREHQTEVLAALTAAIQQACASPGARAVVPAQEGTCTGS